MTPEAATPSIAQLDPFGSDGDGHLVNDAWNTGLRELVPSRPERTLAEWRAANGSPAFELVVFGAAGGEGELRGLAIVGVFVDGSNPDLAVVQVMVKPEHRRAGLGTQLLRRATDHVSLSGRSIVLGDAYDTVRAGGLFAQRFGGSPDLVSRAIELDLRALDAGVIDRWITDGPVRAVGYEVVVVEGDYPEDYIEDLAHVIWSVASDMPTDDLDFEPLAVTPARLREDRTRELERYEVLMAIALDKTTGRPVGLSEVVRSRSAPESLETTTTGVLAAHRGHALGKWLKACLYSAIGERWPEARYVKTENAGSNDAMRGINDGLGFTLLHTETAYQADLATIIKQLDAYERAEA